MFPILALADKTQFQTTISTCTTPTLYFEDDTDCSHAILQADTPCINGQLTNEYKD